MSIAAWMVAASLCQAEPVGGGGGEVGASDAAAAGKQEVGGKPSIEIYDVRDLLPSYRSGRRVDDPDSAGEAGAKSRSKRAGDPDAPGESGETASPTPILGDLPVLGALFRGQTADDIAQAEAEADAATRTVLRTLLQCFGATFDDSLTCEINENGAMVVRARAAAHRRIADFLVGLRTDRAPQLSVEVAIFELDQDDRQHLVDFVRPHGVTLERDRASQVDPKLFFAFIEHNRSSRLVTPKVVTKSLTRYVATAGTSVSYVSALDQVSIEGIGTVVDPVIKQLFEGFEIDAIGVAMETIGTVPAPYALKLKTRMTAIKRPIETVKTDFGVIQMPETRHTEFSTTIAGFLGTPVIVGGVPRPGFDGKDDVRLYLMVTVKPVAAR